MNTKTVHAGDTPVTEEQDNQKHSVGTWILLALMYLILFVTLYLIWTKANPPWWA